MSSSRRVKTNLRNIMIPKNKDAVMSSCLVWRQCMMVYHCKIYDWKITIHQFSNASKVLLTLCTALPLRPGSITKLVTQNFAQLKPCSLWAESWPELDLYVQCHLSIWIGLRFFILFLASEEKEASKQCDQKHHQMSLKVAQKWFY